MQTPSQKGAIAETAIAASAIKAGLQVLKPVAEGGRYDLAFEIGGRLARVQCKWASRRGDVITARIRTSRRVNGGYLSTTYSPDEVDFVALYCPQLDASYLLPITLVQGQSTIHLRLASARNRQLAGLHFARDYALGAIAQLEERAAGSRKVVGSSPTSSISSPKASGPELVSAHEFRNRFGWYMQRAVAGEPILVTHRGQPRLRLSPVLQQTRLAA